MNDPDPTRTAPAHPPISSSSDMQPRDTLLQRGAFDPPATPGTLGRLDRFEILRLLGEGGMGQVYLAREPLTDTQVAIKIMKPDAADDPREVHRFLTEARHMYRLAHPRILRVLEVSDRPAGPYYVMPYIAGGSLLARCKPGETLPETEVLAIARQVAEALAHAHSHGLIHRDLKPGNVLLDKDGNAYLTDFGLVRTLFNDSMVDASASHLEGTAPYMSPAVARGEAEDTRCDIYAFGALLYELLTGQPPYTGRTPQIILDQVLKGPPKPIREVNPKANPVLTRIAEACMARELRDRYASMGDIISDLDRVAQGQAPLGQHGQADRSSRSRKIPVIAGAAVLIGLAAIGSLWFADRERKAGLAGPNTSPSSPPTAAAEKATGPIPFEYTTQNDAITITAYTGSDASMAIPGMIAGRPVTRIADQAFKSCVALTNVAIPASVTFLGKEAFAGCTNLASVHFEGYAPGGGSYSSLFEGANKATVYYAPGTKGWTATYGGRPAFLLADGFECTSTSNAVTITKYAGPGGDVIIPSEIDGRPVASIGDRAFDGCTALTAVSVPGSVTNIGAAAFAGCSGLTNAILAKGVSTIGDSAFSGCANLRDVTIPGSVVSIGHWAFDHTGLTRVTVPASLTNIGVCPFRGSVEAIMVDAANLAYSSRDGVLFDKTGTSLHSYASGKAGGYEIPDGVVSVYNCAFRSCGTITSVVIAASVKELRYKAFASCGNLSAVFCKGDAPSAGASVLSGTRATVYYRPGTKGWGATFGGRPTAVWEEEELPAEPLPTPDLTGAKTEGPFSYTVADGKATIVKYNGPGGDVSIPHEIKGLPVTGIGENSFASCTNLTNIIIPNGITHIGRGAFWSCHGLTTVKFPASLTEIGAEAFNNCGGLTDVVIPAGVTSIGWGPFIYCPRLASIAVDAANPNYCTDKAGVLFDKAKTILINYPPGRSGHYDIPDSVTRIADSAFRGSKLLTRVTVPESVTSIGYRAFCRCDEMTGAYFKGDAPSLGTGAFVYINKATVYYRPGTKGWVKEFGGRPTKEWEP